MLSDGDAAIIAGVIGGVMGLAGVWLGYYLSRRASEKDRRAEKLLALYRELEVLGNLLIAVQKGMIDQGQFFRKWNNTTENIMGALIGSDVDRKRVLKAINVKWKDPRGVTEVKALADELLEKLDPEYARAGRELCKELGIKPEDIDPVIIAR
jgi:hypothetical protein